MRTLVAIALATFFVGGCSKPCETPYTYDDGVDADGDGMGIAPTPATAGDDLYAVVYDMPDDGKVYYDWFQDDFKRDDAEDCAVPATLTKEGEMWWVTVSNVSSDGAYVPGMYGGFRSDGPSTARNSGTGDLVGVEAVVIEPD